MYGSLLVFDNWWVWQVLSLIPDYQRHSATSLVSLPLGLRILITSTMTELSRWFSMAFDNMKVDIISSISFLTKPTIPFGLKPERTCTPVSATSIRWEVYWRQWMRRTWWVTRCQTVMMSAWSNLCQNMPNQYRNMPIHFSWLLFPCLSCGVTRCWWRPWWSCSAWKRRKTVWRRCARSMCSRCLVLALKELLWVKWLWCHSKSWNAHVLNFQRLCQGIWSLTPLC